jgi:DNA gyrase subunit B
MFPTILLITILLTQHCIQLGIFGYYSIKKDYIIEKLCINKDKPQLHCDGKCYLGKQLKTTEEGAKSSAAKIQKEKALEYKIYENDEIRNIFTALGVKIGTAEDSKALDTSKLRYHKVVIMCDADVDGSHITTLILTFLFRYMKDLIDGGKIYIAQPPLYMVKKGKDFIYCWTDAQREVATEQLAKGGNRDSVNIQRYKGLGEMNAEQLWETTMNPETRTLKRVTIDSAAEADHVFSMLMGDEVPPRREFIEANSKYAKIDV